MELTPEIIAEAKQIAETHKLKEVFVTEKGEFFSTAREARNSKPKEVVKAYSVTEAQETEALEEKTVQETGASDTDLDAENTVKSEQLSVVSEEVTTTITEPEEVTVKQEDTKEAKTPKRPSFSVDLNETPKASK